MTYIPLKETLKKKRLENTATAEKDPIPGASRWCVPSAVSQLDRAAASFQKKGSLKGYGCAPAVFLFLCALHYMCTGYDTKYATRKEGFLLRKRLTFQIWSYAIWII